MLFRSLLFTTVAALCHDEHEDHAGHGQVGSVNFSNSCAPAVQADLARGVAMLHSFWFGAGEQVFRNVLAKDPTCAIAYWGIASLLMLNPLLARLVQGATGAAECPDCASVRRTDAR